MDFGLFPGMGILIEGRTFADNKANYTLQTNRIFDIDVLKIKSIFLSFNLNESLLFNEKNSKRVNPRSIFYDMDYGNLRWENSLGILSFFANHNCLNIINDNKVDEKMLRWYGYGLRWESYGMQTGRKDKKAGLISPDNFLSHISYRLSAAKKYYTHYFDYKYMFSGTLRYDIINNFFLIPYIEGSFTSLTGDNTKTNRYFETGIRIHSGNGDITPFAGVNKKYDFDFGNGRYLDLYYIGLRIESALPYENKTHKTGTASGSRFMDFHFSGSYAKYIADENLNFNTDILAGLDFFSGSIISPFFISRLMHSSLRESAGLYPRYLQENIETGISLRMEYINAFIEPFYKYHRFDQGNSRSDYPVQYAESGLRIISTEMKTGFANKGIDFHKTAGIETINRIDWSFSAARIIREENYGYDWEYILNVRWNLIRIYNSIPYISGGITILKDCNYNRIYDIESGIRIQTGLCWILFYKYKYRTAAETENGIYRDYHLTGIRFEI